MNIIDTYYLVDYENVGSNGLSGCKNMTASDHILIFFTQNARKIDMAMIANHGTAELKMIEIPAGKQSADMHIVSYLGYLAGTSNCNIIIISKDTDFDHVIQFWKKDSAFPFPAKKAFEERRSRSKVIHRQAHRLQKKHRFVLYLTRISINHHILRRRKLSLLFFSMPQISNLSTRN